MDEFQKMMLDQFSELREQNKAINDQLVAMNDRFDKLETETRDGFERMDNKFDSLTRRVARLDDKVDRNYDTLLDGFHGAFENLADALDKKADAQ